MELIFDPDKIDLKDLIDESDLKEESFAFDHERYDKWSEFRSFMYNLQEMRNEGCRGCEEPPTTCRKCMQDYYWLNIKYYL